MLPLSLPVGRWFGVHVRLHLSLLLLLALAAGYSVVATHSALRGVALWGLLLSALVLRELVRMVMAGYFGLPVRAVILLPVGGVLALAPRHGSMPTSRARTMMLSGTAANFLAALLLLGFSYGIDPHVRLLQQPWITVTHLLRSAVWLQVLVGTVNLLPPASLPRALSPRSLSAPASPAGPFALRPVRGVALMLMLGLIASGLVFGMIWPVLLGFLVLMTGLLNRSAAAATPDSLPVSVRDVMLTEVHPLSASSTLRDALQQTTHTVQELFPVLRGERLVGWISRGHLAAALRAEGDGFLQGAMSRSFQTVAPGERVGEALRRATTLGTGEFVPVVEGGAMVGMLTPRSLERAVGQLHLTRSAQESDAR